METRHLGEIVIVDDTPANLRLLSQLLGGHGYQVRPFPSGKLALSGLNHGRADLILLDIQMPQMNGYQVCQRLKSQPHTRDIPIIFISALNEVLDKVQAFASGGVDYITKPFQTEEVLARVATHIELFRLQRQLQDQTVAQASQLAEQNQQLWQMNQELQTQYRLIQETQLQLVQTEKLASLGSLVAGVAHEINNPLGFISGNLKFTQEQITDLLEVIQLYQKLDIPLSEDLRDRLDELDLDFLLEDLPQSLQSMEKGVKTIQNISQALRILSRSENSQQKSDFDLHSGLNSTLMILRYRLKANETRPEVEIVKDYGELPDIACYPGKLNQVFMNIIANAIDAFDEQNEGMSYQDITLVPNQIAIQTRLTAANTVKITIQDNGTGMTEAVRLRIFEQGFTTKPAGKGTGLGMAIAHQIIEVDHGGSLTLDSTFGEGSTFTIILPL